MLGGAGGKGDDRGWDGWMASLTRWTWVWVNSGSWWWTGRPGVLIHGVAKSQTRLSKWTELNWTEKWIHCRELANAIKYVMEKERATHSSILAYNLAIKTSMWTTCPSKKKSDRGNKSTYSGAEATGGRCPTHLGTIQGREEHTHLKKITWRSPAKAVRSAGGAGRGVCLKHSPVCWDTGPSGAPMTVNTHVSHYKGITCRQLMYNDFNPWISRGAVMIPDKRWNAQPLKRLEAEVCSPWKHLVLSEEGGGSGVLGSRWGRVYAPGPRGHSTLWRCLPRPCFSSWAWQRLSLRPLLGGRLEKRGGDKDAVYPKYTSCGSSCWVYREDLMLNLLIRTNYAKITLKSCLIDGTVQWEFL